MKTTEENNKLIAKFMGFVYPMLKDIIVINHEVIDVEDLQYHTSWDWLMPVVQKCYDTAPSEIVSTLDDGNDIGDITHALIDIDIDGVYRAVVKFIEQQYENYLEEKADSDISIMKDEGLM